MMDARSLTGGARLRRLRARVVLDEREVDRAVGEVARRVVAHSVGVHLGKSENLAVEPGGALEVVDPQREMHDAAHFSSFFSNDLNLRTFGSLSSAHIASHRR